ncbi:hypothetical protein H0H92_003667 [Tricholoma furcatifolium]|nr:hypothetical protein H0H92_003667 [Tricholoma furcatifolium]
MTRTSGSKPAVNSASNSISWNDFLTAIRDGFPTGSQGKQYNGPMSSFYRAGKLIPRLVNPFLELNAVFIRGLVAGNLLDSMYLDPDNSKSMEVNGKEKDERNESDENDEFEDDHANESQISNELYLEAFDTILTLESTIVRTLKRLCGAMKKVDYYHSDLRHFVSFFTKGAISARTGDTRKVKEGMMEIIQVLWNSGALQYLINDLVYPLPSAKSDRSFNDYNTGALLCPARLLYLYDNTYHLLLRDGKVEVTAHDYPAFMYDDSRSFRENSTGFPGGGVDDDSEDDDDDIYERITTGLCRGPLLISVCQHIFFGSGIDRSEKHATKPPIASSYQIMSITGEMITYSAVQARFALGSVTSWKMSEGLFSYHDFYNNVLQLFNPPSDWSRETLKYWNKIFYSEDGTIRIKRKIAPPPPKPSSDISHLRRALKQRAREEKNRQQEETARQEREEHERRVQRWRQREAEREQRRANERAQRRAQDDEDYGGNFEGEYTQRQAKRKSPLVLYDNDDDDDDSQVNNGGGDPSRLFDDDAAGYERGGAV